MGNWRQKWLRFLTSEPQGTALAEGAYQRGSALSGLPFVETQCAHLYLLPWDKTRVSAGDLHFPVSQGGARSPSQASSTQGMSKGPRSESEQGLLSPLWLPLPRTSSSSSGTWLPPEKRLGLQSGNCPIKCVNIPPVPLPLPTPWGPMAWKQSLATESFYVDKSWAKQLGSFGQPLPPSLTSISWVRRKNSVKGVSFPRILARYLERNMGSGLWKAWIPIQSLPLTCCVTFP